MTRFFKLALLATALPLAGNAFAADLTVEVSALRADTGTVRAAIYASETDYAANRNGISVTATVSGDSVTLDFPGLTDGTYAIKMFHDIDDDGEMKTGAMGIPQEPYAFSNNAQGRFGPAKWKKAAFTVSGDAPVHSVKLN